MTKASVHEVKTPVCLRGTSGRSDPPNYVTNYLPQLPPRERRTARPTPRHHPSTLRSGPNLHSPTHRVAAQFN